MKLKFVAVFLSIVLCIPLFSTTSFAVSGPELPGGVMADDRGEIEIIGMGEGYTSEQTMAVIDAMPIIDKYIKPNSENKLELDPSAIEVVGEHVYAHYQKGIESINRSIDDGNFSVDQVKNTLVPMKEASKMIPAYYEKEGKQEASVNKYWWGIKWTFSEKESKELQNQLSDNTVIWGGVAAIAGVFGSYIPFAHVATVMAIFFMFGNLYFLAQLRDNTSSKGSVLVFKWAPPSAYAYAR